MRLSTRFLAVATFALCLIGNAKDAEAAGDKQFESFWKSFKAALQRNDKEAVASMTKLPYLLDSKNLSRDQFLKKYDQLFPPKVRACLAKEKPVADKDSYSAFCGEQIFIFAKVKGKYLFTEIGAND